MFTSADEVLRSSRTRTSSSSTSGSPTCPVSSSTSTCRPPAVRRGLLHRGRACSTARRSAGSPQIHKSDMKLIPDLATAYVDPFRAAKTLNINFSIVEPRTGEPYEPRPAPGRREGRGVPAVAPASPTPPTSARRPSSTSSTTCASRPSRTRATTTSTPIEGAWNTGRVEEGGNRGYKTRYKGGYFPVPPVDHYADLRDQMTAALIAAGHRGRARAPRGRHRRPGRDQLPVRHPARTRPTTC